MYSDRRKNTKQQLLWALSVLLLCAGLMLFLSDGGRDISENSSAAIRAAVQRSALQCYAVEGAYPPDLRYLEDNYGLQINHEDFYVTYDAFASNLPPEIRVTVR
jgi:hypothetical protein